MYRQKYILSDGRSLFILEKIFYFLYNFSIFLSNVFQKYNIMYKIKYNLLKNAHFCRFFLMIS